VTVDGAMVKIASGPGSPAELGEAGALVAPIDPDPAAEADVADPGEEAKYKRDPNQPKKGKYGPQPGPPWVPPKPGPNPDPNKKTWIEIELIDDDGNPVPGAKYEITLPDGRIYPGTLDNKGCARVDGIDPGTCQVTFPELDRDTWGPA
jgi:type VI secretion system secreted protein VgrG